MRKKILVVDDQFINRTLLKAILSGEYDTLEAEDGIEAVEILKKRGSEISGVILDLIMPKMDGYGVLAEMTKDAVLSKIPVVVASQAEKSEMEEKALKCGARDFISKPYNPGILRQRLRNLVELYESNRHIMTMERDSLTGLYTKDAFFRHVKEVWSANPGKEYLLVASDIERFKLVNDSFGNPEGDRLLQFIAEELQKVMEPEGGICGRMNADHFVILIPRESGRDLFGIMEKTLKERLADYPLNMRISLKFGLYEINDRDIELSNMCDRAMLAANTIKGKYGTSYAYYDDIIRQKMLKEQQILDTMKTALAEHQFQVYFQPKYDLMTERIAGAEALVRWIHPEFGFMNPGEFIPLFEKNGFITEVDRYVWEKTCEVISGWLRAKNKYIPVSMNVSRKDIYQENLPELFLDMVKRYGLEPKHLHLEITESAYTEDAEQLIQVVKQLKEAGFTIEMDDFGSGYSSLNMLSELPLDILKLDMRFIQQESEKNESRNIMSFIISMAKWMNLGVVAEGVETKEQIDLLRNMDCDYVQGYYYSKPKPEAEFTKEVLTSALETELPGRKEVRTAEQTRKNASKGHQMLIVDDMEINRAILAEMFQDDFNIVEAENGAQALDYIKVHFDKISIIMLDLIMPEMDGFQLLRKLQANPLYCTIPVIITSQAGVEREAEAFELGAGDFLAKPYDPALARHRVENAMAQRRVQELKRQNIQMKKELEEYRKK